MAKLALGPKVLRGCSQNNCRSHPAILLARAVLEIMQRGLFPLRNLWKWTVILTLGESLEQACY